jgi:hypothetical protein
VNPNARKRLTDATLIALAARLVAAGNRNSDGGVPVIIPRQLAEDIRALAYDRSRHIARKARLDTAVTA